MAGKSFNESAVLGLSGTIATSTIHEKITSHIVPIPYLYFDSRTAIPLF